MAQERGKDPANGQQRIRRGGVRRVRMRLACILLILLAGCATAGSGPAPDILFCEQTDCAAALAGLIRNSSSVSCALYSLRSESVAQALIDANARVVMNHGSIAGAKVKRAHAEQGLMHNKFCVMDGTVWTGSWNPAEKSTMADNAVILRSETITAAYLAEFEELWAGVLRRGDRTRRSGAALGGMAAEVHFCPDDACGARVVREIEGANRTIHAMVYSFTDMRVVDALRERRESGVDVRIVMDTGQAKQKHAKRMEGMSVRAGVHHKVFIIDGTTVVTGSYNPTLAGDLWNDENLLILRSGGIAQRYLQEFERVSANATRLPFP